MKMGVFDRMNRGLSSLDRSRQEPKKPTRADGRADLRQAMPDITANGRSSEP